MIEIKEFTAQDIDAVYAVQQAAYKPLFDKYHDSETSPYMESREKVLQKYTRAGTKGYLFLEDGMPVGAVRINSDPESKSARVSALGVLPERQGRGIAQQALLTIEKMYGDIEHWKLDTILQEKGNCHLYEKLGYRKTGKTEEINEMMTLVYYEKDMQPDVVAMLADTKDRNACDRAAVIISESHESCKWYGHFDEFVSLLSHPNSLVRNRALYLLAANARWDREERFDAVLPEYLSHITDEKPITARQCVKALAEVGQAKPRYIPRILTALREADLSKYRDSMRPLIERDLRETEEKLTRFLREGQ